MTAPLLAIYDEVAPLLAAHGEAIHGRLAGWLTSDDALKLHSITLRLKDRDSLAAKLARPDRTYRALWDVTDLVGLRVITYFEDGVDRVGELLASRLPVDFHHSIDKRRHHDDRFGYRSLHFVCRVATGDDPRLPRELRYEIQVRTMLQHAWAEIEHDLGYKSDDSVPAAARRRLNRLAGLLELADQEFLAIRRELADYASGLPARIASADEVGLDRLSLTVLLACDEAVGLDREIARLVGRPLGDQPFFPDYLLRMLAAAGVRTLAAAREGLRRHHRAIQGMVAPYFAFTTRTWRLSPAQMTQLARGYALFFLALATALEAPALGGDPVERLGRFYEELDYPDDPAEAARVARELAPALLVATIDEDELASG